MSKTEQMPSRRKKVQPKIKARLQKEINSECPFCPNEDVAFFEIHHIDGNPTNSDDFGNLLMLCPTCHAKIEKGQISHAEVVDKKAALIDRAWKVEFVSVTTDVSACGWSSSAENEFAFYKSNDGVDANPVLNFTFINHVSSTIVLSEINVAAKHMFSGISGIRKHRLPEPNALQAVAKYYIQLRGNGEVSTLRLPNPIEVPAGRAFLFQIEIYPIEGRVITYFNFKFGNASSVKVPSIYFNCKDESERTQISIVGFDGCPAPPTFTIRILS